LNLLKIMQIVIKITNMELKLTPEIIKNLSIKVDNFVYLWLKYVGEEPNFDKSVELMMDGYIYPAGGITKKGKDLVESVVGVEVKQDIYEAMLLQIRAEMKKYVGKDQIKGFGNVYFRPTEVELKQSLQRFWKQYPKYTDVDKILKIISNHIQSCAKRGSFAPAIKYYIIKERSKALWVSELASAYDNFEEKEQVLKTTFEL